ncbi:MAG: DUF3352 domain-containing protein [Pseudanabaena sp. RU_4_16]|nr:DUF3352 domain-containing protein [Pseudanabaena sp. RU_4_16]
MAIRKLGLLAPICGMAIVAGSSVDYLYAQVNTIRPAEPIVSAARFVPQQAVMAVSFSPDRKTWSQLDRFHTPNTKKLFNRAIASSQTSIFPKYDFERDIQPWLGNVTFVVFPNTSMASKNEGSSESNFLFIIEVKDINNASKFIEEETVNNSGKVSPKEEYQGFKIVQIDYENGKPFIYTFVDKYLVFAEQEVLLKKAIDTYKSKVSLASAIAKDNLDLKNPVFWLYMPNLPGFIEQFSSSYADLPAESLTALNSIESINLGIGIDSDGIRLKASTKLKPKSIYLNVFKPSPGRIISQFPSETIGLVSGSDLKTHWQQLVRDVERMPELKTSLQEFRLVLKSSPLALDLDKDVFGWMDGEFAFAGISTQEGIFAQLGFAPVWILQTSDRRSAESLLKKLNEFIKGSFGLVETKTIGSIPVTQWMFPGAPEPILSYGWYRNDTMFVTFGGSLPKLLASKPQEPLPDSSAFRAIAGSLPRPNLGYFYLDMDKTWKLISAKFPDSANISPEATAILSRIRGIGVTVTAPDSSTTQTEMLLSLKQRGFGGVWY